MFWEKDSVESKIFKQYEQALVSLGINFSLQEVQTALEGCTYGLEDAISCTIDYVLWLQKHEKVTRIPLVWFHSQIKLCSDKLSISFGWIYVFYYLSFTYSNQTLTKNFACCRLKLFLRCTCLTQID